MWKSVFICILQSSCLNMDMEFWGHMIEIMLTFNYISSGSPVILRGHSMFHVFVSTWCLAKIHLFIYIWTAKWWREGEIVSGGGREGEVREQEEKQKSSHQRAHFPRAVEGQTEEQNQRTHFCSPMWAAWTQVLRSTSYSHISVSTLVGSWIWSILEATEPTVPQGFALWIGTSL